jgi:YidC/Oxa1 family membrane protein insertase
MKDEGMMKRIIIATVISFVFFMAYDYFVIQPQTKVANEVAQHQKNANTNTTKTNNQIENSNNEISKTEVKKAKIIATVKSSAFEVHIDELGRISQYILEKNIFNDDKGHKLELLGNKLPKPMEIRFKNEELNKEAFHTPVTIDKSDVVLNGKQQTVTLTKKLKELTIQKIITFYPDGHYDLNVKLSKDKPYFLAVGYEPQAAVNMYAFHGAILENSDGTLDKISDGDAEDKTFKNIKIAAMVDQYYTTFMYNLKNPMTVIETSDNPSDKVPVLYIKGEQNLNLHGYIGPKYVEVLKSINPELTKVVDYGFMTFLAKPMFSVIAFLYNIVHNWGVAIILFVVLVRLILFPLTYRGMVSMYKLKEMAPKMKELKEKYGKDPQKFQMKTMEMYKKEGANPLGGCLPMLIQIPIFFAIYRVLINAIELKGASFLWIHDLSAMDPYFILPVLMGLTMYLHQRVTPNNFTDPMQEKIFKFLPLIFTFFFFSFAAGLVLYWTTNNILSFLQQLVINKKMQAIEKAKKEAKK